MIMESGGAPFVLSFDARVVAFFFKGVIAELIPSKALEVVSTTVPFIVDGIHKMDIRLDTINFYALSGNTRIPPTSAPLLKIEVVYVTFIAILNRCNKERSYNIPSTQQ